MLHGENLVVRIHGFKEQTTVLYLGRSNYHCSCFVFLYYCWLMVVQISLCSK